LASSSSRRSSATTCNGIASAIAVTVGARNISSRIRRRWRCCVKSTAPVSRRPATCVKSTAPVCRWRCCVKSTAPVCRRPAACVKSTAPVCRRPAATVRRSHDAGDWESSAVRIVGTQEEPGAAARDETPPEDVTGEESRSATGQYRTTASRAQSAEERRDVRSAVKCTTDSGVTV
jgi:hypothetical protein